MKGPVRIETSRLVLRKPIPADATEIYIRYASDPDVTRYLAWPTHTSIDQTRLFLMYSNAEWDRWPAGPYLIEDRSCGKLLGGTGLAFEAPEIASTGYVLARDAWGQGYATEALRAIVELAPEVGIRSLYAICHADHKASIHVLEKCGFQLEENLLAQFPNLDDGCQANCLRYVLQTD